MRTSIYRPKPLQDRRDHQLRRPILLPRRPVNHPRRGHRTEGVLVELMDCDTASTTRGIPGMWSPKPTRDYAIAKDYMVKRNVQTPAIRPREQRPSPVATAVQVAMIQ